MSAVLPTMQRVEGAPRVTTLRDHFAGLAMQAQVSTDMAPGEAADALLEAAEEAGQDPVFRLALNSYDIADAMLRARNTPAADSARLDYLCRSYGMSRQTIDEAMASEVRA